MREPVLLRAERIRLAGLRRDRPDLLDLVAEEIELAFTIARIILQPAERPSCRRGALVRLSVGSDGPQVLGTRVSVQEGRLRGGVEEPKGAVLPVDLDQPGADVAQGRSGGQLPADASAALAVGAHAACQDHLAVFDPVHRHVVWPDWVRHPSVRDLEPRLDPGCLGAGSDKMRATPRPSREREPDREHGLARPGLAGEDREPLAQLKIEVADDTETADMELTEHARILAGATDIAGRHRDPRRGLAGISGEVELVAHPRQEARRVVASDETSRSVRGADPHLGADRISCVSRPSAETNPGSSPTTSRLTTLLAPRTNERSNTMCAAIGVTIRQGTSGDTIGPRAENE